MRPKSIALLILALGCGLVAAIGITQVMANKEQKEAPVAETETIFVAMEDIDCNKKISSQVLRLEDWPRDKVPSGAVTKIEDVEGHFARTKIFAGEAILEQKLDDSNTGVVERIPPGFRVVAVKVKDDSGGAGLITPHSRVDVLVHLVRNPQRGIQKTGTVTILQDIRVFAVNNLVDIEDTTDGEPQSITANTISLLVTPQQAATLMTATEMGTIRLVMRGRDETQVDDIPIAYAENLIDLADIGDPEKEDPFAAAAGSTMQTNDLSNVLGQPAQPPAPVQVETPPAANEHRIRILSGDEIRVEVLRQEKAGEGETSDGQWIPSGAYESKSPRRNSVAVDQDSDATDPTPPTQDQPEPEPEPPVDED